MAPQLSDLTDITNAVNGWVASPETNELYWIDAFFMAGPPPFARMGNLTGNTNYYEKLWQMYDYMENGLVNPNPAAPEACTLDGSQTEIYRGPAGTFTWWESAASLPTSSRSRRPPRHNSFAIKSYQGSSHRKGLDEALPVHVVQENVLPTVLPGS
jgi:hypothetical protein